MRISRYDMKSENLYLFRLFIDKSMRRMFRFKRDGNGEWRRLHNEEFHSFVLFTYVERVIKSSRSRWTGHVVRMEEGRSAFNMYTYRKEVFMTEYKGGQY